MATRPSFSDYEVSPILSTSSSKYDKDMYRSPQPRGQATQSHKTDTDVSSMSPMRALDLGASPGPSSVGDATTPLRYRRHIESDNSAARSLGADESKSPRTPQSALAPKERISRTKKIVRESPVGKSADSSSLTRSPSGKRAPTNSPSRRGKVTGSPARVAASASPARQKLAAKTSSSTKSHKKDGVPTSSRDAVGHSKEKDNDVSGTADRTNECAEDNKVTPKDPTTTTAQIPQAPTFTMVTKQLIALSPVKGAVSASVISAASPSPIYTTPRNDDISLEDRPPTPTFNYDSSSQQFSFGDNSAQKYSSSSEMHVSANATPQSDVGKLESSAPTFGSQRDPSLGSMWDPTPERTGKSFSATHAAPQGPRAPFGAENSLTGGLSLEDELAMASPGMKSAVTTTASSLPLNPASKTSPRTLPGAVSRAPKTNTSPRAKPTTSSPVLKPAASPPLKPLSKASPLKPAFAPLSPPQAAAAQAAHVAPPSRGSPRLPAKAVPPSRDLSPPPAYATAPFRESLPLPTHSHNYFAERPEPGAEPFPYREDIPFTSNSFSVNEHADAVDFSSEPITDRIRSKDVKRRESAYVELQECFLKNDEASFHTLRSHLSEALSETLPVGFEASLKAILVYCEKVPIADPSDMNTILCGLFSSRALDKTKFQVLSVQIILVICGIVTLPQVSEVIIQYIEVWETKKQSVGILKKQLSFGISLFKTMIHEFGLAKLPPQTGYLTPVLKYIGDTDRSVREACYSVLMELHAFDVQVCDLTPTLAEQQKRELLKRCEVKIEKPKPTRFYRGEEHTQGSTDILLDAEVPATLDSFDFSEPFDVWKELPKGWNMENLPSLGTWQEKVKHLSMLTQLVERPKLVMNERYDAAVPLLLRTLSLESNVPVVQEAAKILGLMSKGLRNEFKHGKACVKAFLHRVLDKSVWKASVLSGDNFYNLWYSVIGEAIAEEVCNKMKGQGSHFAQKEAAMVFVRLLDHPKADEEEVKRIAAIAIPFLITGCDDPMNDVRAHAAKCLAIVAMRSHTAFAEIFAKLPTPRRSMFEKAWKDAGGVREVRRSMSCDLGRGRNRNLRRRSGSLTSRYRPQSVGRLAPEKYQHGLSYTEGEKLLEEALPRDLLHAFQQSRISAEAVRDMDQWWTQSQKALEPLAQHIVVYLHDKTRFIDTRPIVMKHLIALIRKLPALCGPSFQDSKARRLVVPCLIERLSCKKVGDEVADILMEFASLLGADTIMEQCAKQKTLRAETVALASKLVLKFGLGACGVQWVFEVVDRGMKQGTSHQRNAVRLASLCCRYHSDIHHIFQQMLPPDVYQKMMGSLLLDGQISSTQCVDDAMLAPFLRGKVIRQLEPRNCSDACLDDSMRNAAQNNAARSLRRGSSTTKNKTIVRANSAGTFGQRRNRCPTPRSVDSTPREPLAHNPRRAESPSRSRDPSPMRRPLDTASDCSTRRERSPAARGRSVTRVGGLPATGPRGFSPARDMPAFILQWRKHDHSKEVRQGKERHFWGPHEIPKEYVADLKDALRSVLRNDCSMMWGGADEMMAALKGWETAFKKDIDEVVSVLDMVLKYLTWVLERNRSPKVTKAALDAFACLLDSLQVSGYEWTEREIDVTLPIVCERLGQTSTVTFVKDLYLHCANTMIKQMGPERVAPRLCKALQSKNKKSMEIVFGLLWNALKECQTIPVSTVERFLLPALEDTSAEIRKLALRCVAEVLNIVDYDAQEKLKKGIKPQMLMRLTASSVVPDTARVTSPVLSARAPRKLTLSPQQLSERNILGTLDSKDWISVCHHVVALLENSEEHNDKILERVANLLCTQLATVEVRAVSHVLCALLSEKKQLSVESLTRLMASLLTAMKTSLHGGIVLDCGETWVEFIQLKCRALAQRLLDVGGKTMERTSCDFLLALTKIREDFETERGTTKAPPPSDQMRSFQGDCKILSTANHTPEAYSSACTRLLVEPKNTEQDAWLARLFPEMLKVSFDKVNKIVQPWGHPLLDLVVRTVEKSDMLAFACSENTLRDLLRELLRTLNWFNWTKPDEAWKLYANKINMATVCILLTCSKLHHGIFVYSLLLKFGLFERNTIGGVLVVKCIRKLNKTLVVDPSNVHEWCALLRDFADCLSRSCPDSFLVQESINHASELYATLCARNEGVTSTLLHMLTTLSPCAQAHLRRIFHSGSQEDLHRGAQDHERPVENGMSNPPC
eukprot:GEMP01000391.1.p1 GENE.GEMP01000391.1~~GEMP01000391.1.p1  ORF type:complete len:2198 (+),score=472.93 GEMP01000391.1:36-6629(+)